MRTLRSYNFFSGGRCAAGRFFSPPSRAGHRSARGCCSMRTRDARVRRFSIFSFTASPLGCKRLDESGLRVKDSPFYVHISFVFNLLEISVLWVKALPRGHLHPSIGAARTGWEWGKARVKEKRGEIFTLNILCVSMLRGVGEAVKGKNEKWLTGARYVRARDGTLHPAEQGDPAAERKKRGRTTKKQGGGDEKRATFRPPEARREQRPRSTANHRGPMQKKRVGGGGIAEDFVTLPLQTGCAPRGADLRPAAATAGPLRREIIPLACVTLKRP